MARPSRTPWMSRIASMGNDRGADTQSGATSIASAQAGERDEPALGRCPGQDEEPSQELPPVSRMTVRL